MVEKPSGTPTTVQNDGALFHALIGATVDGVVVIDAAGRIQDFNAACEALFGYTAAEVIGHSATMLMPARFRAEYEDYLSHRKLTSKQRIVDTGREMVGQRKDKSTFPMYLSVGESQIHGERFFVGVIRDLAAKLKMEVSLRESADRLLAQIVRSSNEAILSKTLGGVIMSWNAAAERIFGYTAGEAVGKHISVLIPSDRLAEEAAIIAQLRAGHDVEHLETVRRRKDGRDIPVCISVSPVFDGEGNIFGASKTLRDISEKKEAEVRLQAMQSELAHVGRLNSMGFMSSAIAHELNQPLTAISNFVEAARRTLDLPGDDIVLRARNLMDKAVGQTLRAGAIIRNLRDFVEKREGKRRPENIDSVIEEAIALAMVGAASGRVRVKLDLAPALPLVPIDRIQIQQVLINLIRNAVEAMQAVDERDLTIAAKLESDAVCITVRDTGPGLTPKMLARLFQPFVTTKEKGMGIGLSICKSIVEAHGGRMSVQSSGRGACFAVHLPLALEETA